MSGKKCKVNGGYAVKFNNPITSEYKYVGFFKLEADADNKISELDLDFYKYNTQYLPKGVTVSKKSFILKIKTFTISGKGDYNKQIATARTVAEIKELKLKCISSIIG